MIEAPPLAYLRLDRLTKRFGPIVAVDDVSLTVRRGEFMTLLGPSGSGKTTTLSIIAGFDAPTSGVYCFMNSRSGRCRRTAAISAWCFSATRCSPT